MPLATASCDAGYGVPWPIASLSNRPEFRSSLDAFAFRFNAASLRLRRRAHQPFTQHVLASTGGIGISARRKCDAGSNRATTLPSAAIAAVTVNNLWLTVNIGIKQHRSPFTLRAPLPPCQFPNLLIRKG
jgi:hypothetical protein